MKYHLGNLLIPWTVYQPQVLIYHGICKCGITYTCEIDRKTLLNTQAKTVKNVRKLLEMKVTDHRCFRLTNHQFS